MAPTNQTARIPAAANKMSLNLNQLEQPQCIVASTSQEAVSTFQTCQPCQAQVLNLACDQDLLSTIGIDSNKSFLLLPASAITTNSPVAQQTYQLNGGTLQVLPNGGNIQLVGLNDSFITLAQSPTIDQQQQHASTSTQSQPQYFCTGGKDVEFPIQILAQAGPSNVSNKSDEEPLYVNAKQYARILKRRTARAKMESEGRIPKERRKYLHESRHKHALTRVRGEGGKFDRGTRPLPAQELQEHITNGQIRTVFRPVYCPTLTAKQSGSSTSCTNTQ